MSNKVDVTGVDRKRLLEALWKLAKPVGWYFMDRDADLLFDIEQAMNELDGTYADYVCARCIKSDVFSAENFIDPSGYDKEHGKGSFQRVVDSLIYPKTLIYPKIYFK
jgi:hypothetical protein